MQTSKPCELVTAYNNSCDLFPNTINKQSHNCQNTTKTTSSSISGKKLQKQNFSGVVSVCSNKSNKPSNKTTNSDSNKTSNSKEDFFQSYSPLNLDTPSFTENLNTYDFVTDSRDRYYGNSDVFTFHGPKQNLNQGPNIHDTAFCFNNDLGLDADSSDLDRNILQEDNLQKNFAKNQLDNKNKPLKFRANNSSKLNFNQGSDNLDKLKHDIETRKEVIQKLKDQLLNRFEDEDDWVQELKRTRKHMRTLSSIQPSYNN